MRVLAAAIGLLLACLPWTAGAREAAVPVLSAQVLSLLMLDVQFTYRSPKVRKTEPANPAYAELLDPTSAFTAPLVLLPFEPHAPSMESLRSAQFADSISPLARDRWRDFVGSRTIPQRPPLPGSFTDKLIVLQLSDLGDGMVLRVRGGLAVIPVRALGGERPAVR